MGCERTLVRRRPVTVRTWVAPGCGVVLLILGISASMWMRELIMTLPATPAPDVLASLVDSTPITVTLRLHSGDTDLSTTVDELLHSVTTCMLVRYR